VRPNVEEELVPYSGHRRATRRALFVAAAALTIAASLPLAAGAAPPQAGFKTLQPSMVAPGADAPIGTEIKPLITVGDTIGGYRFEAIPDGISAFQSGKNQATLLVNHETSTVPFGYNASPTISNSFNDFNNSELSELVVRKGGGILSAEMVIPTGDGYQRFCSNYLATEDGFEDRPLLFANEEGIDWISETPSYPNGDSWTNTTSLVGAAGAREIGVVVAYDPATGQNRPIWGMGRHNHENSVAIPNFGYPVLLSGDDSFNQNAPQSQLYAYIAEDGDANDVWNDSGRLWAFAPDEDFEAINTYYDFAPNSSLEITGHFELVPRDIAMGKLGANPAARDVLSTDFAYPTPPSDGTWQRGPGISSGAGIDGPQWVLEHWGDPVDETVGDYGHNVFQFLRIEDIAYDKRPGMSNVVYLVDSGRGSSGQGAGISTNGRVWQMVLDPDDPTNVLSLSVLIDGDDSAIKTLGEIHQPDNIESTMNGLLITEDPGSSQQFPYGSVDPAATTARLMYYDFDTEDVTAILKVDQSADEGPTDEDLPPSTGSPYGNLGAWETSGIVDVSSVFGPGKFLINVQAHTLYIDIDTTSAPSNLDGTNDPEADDPDWQYKREGGQLVLVTLPGL